MGKTQQEVTGSGNTQHETVGHRGVPPFVLRPGTRRPLLGDGLGVAESDITSKTIAERLVAVEEDIRVARRAVAQRITTVSPRQRPIDTPSGSLQCFLCFAEQHFFSGDLVGPNSRQSNSGRAVAPGCRE